MPKKVKIKPKNVYKKKVIVYNMREIKIYKTHLIAVVVLIDGYVEDTCWCAGNLGLQVTVQKPVVHDRVAACRNNLKRQQAITAYGISFFATLLGKLTLQILLKANFIQRTQFF